MDDWFDKTKKELRKENNIQKSYHLEFNDREGYLSLTDERIIFLSVNGYHQKNYDKILDLKYDEIKEIYNNNDYSFILIGINEEFHSFSTLKIPALHIINSIEYFRKYSHPNSKATMQVLPMREGFRQDNT